MPITLRNHIPKNYVFPDRGCVRPLRHLYGYATAFQRCYSHSVFWHVTEETNPTQQKQAIQEQNDLSLREHGIHTKLANLTNTMRKI